ncbi:MAG TPA: hypothetical protein VNJ03_12830 [Vicinamibacterales bacterium]|nr:hypothetical protein [Vicinamibacterales bacterium]
MIVVNTVGWGHAAAMTALVMLAACGGGGGSPTTPPPAGGGTTPGTSGATITIANGRVTPSEVTINVGQSVTFTNNDGRVRNISSDPHPAHTDCNAVNAVNNMNNGQTKLTSALTTARTCSFHDHDDPDNGNMKGRIIIR